MLNIALAAHVDSGKTTLSEAMLYLAGSVRTRGRVDHQDAFLDNHPMERARGITIFSKQARLTWRKRAFTLLDTPGHVDFSGEAARTLEAADVCVLVISAPDGVQSHTRSLWTLLEWLGIPVWVFVNKMDRFDGDKQALLGSLRKELSDRLIDITDPESMEQWALCDDASLDYYLTTGTIPAFKRYTLAEERKAFPCFFGSALQNEGVEALLDSLAGFEPKRPDGPFSAKVFKIERDGSGARICFMKVLRGEIRPRDTVSLFEAGEAVWSEKVTALRFYSGAQFTQTESAPAGSIVAAVGLKNPKAGDLLGSGMPAAGPVRFLEPVFTRRVRCRNADLHTLTGALRTLEDEEPLFNVRADVQNNTVTICLSGEVQLEVLQAQLLDRFGLRVSFEEPKVIYKETIAEVAEGVGHFEPLRHYAEVHLWLVPGERGSGVQVASELPLDELAANWQQQILRHLRGISHRGVVIGAELTDIRISLIAGKAHLKHTEGGDFREATERALRQGLMKAGGVILEPLLEAAIDVPGDCLGRVLHEMTLIKAVWDQPTETGGRAKLTARVRARLGADIAVRIRNLTGGQGRCDLSFLEYVPCDDENVKRQFAYDPVRDLDYPTDSIFCAHGAGYSVPWDRVDQMAHLPLRKDRAESLTLPVRRPEAAAYHGTREEDEELLRIFERTYGPIRARQLLPVRRTEHNTPETNAAVTQTADGEILLVDGYNIIFAWDELKKQAQASLEDARLSLCDLMCEYSAMTGRRVIVVFDAYRVPGGSGGAEKYGNIFVIYTREHETADTFIEKATYRSRGSARIIVATSDGPEQAIVIGNQALRLSARDLRDEMRQVQETIRRYLDTGAPNPVPNLAEALRAAWKNSHKL